MKYKLIEETIQHQGVTLYRIQALKDFSDVKKGDLGGWIEKEYNLSQQGDCWVYDNAKVYGDALVFDDVSIRNNADVSGNVRITGNAQIFDNVHIFDNARVYDHAQIYGEAMIYGNAYIYDSALVCDNVHVFNNAQVYDNAKVYGNARLFANVHVKGCAQVFGDTIVYGHACISKNAYIKSTKDYCVFQSFGSRNGVTTFYVNSIRQIYVVCGCFEGSLKEFKSKVLETHGDNDFTKEYITMIKLAKIRLKNKTS